MSAIFSPYMVSCGAVPAVYGLVACLVLELYHTWQRVRAPKTELCRIMFWLVVSFVLGLLPFTSQFASFGGFGFGLLSSAAFLPYETYGSRWCTRRLGRLIGLGGIVSAFVILIPILFSKSDTDCDNCAYFECIDFVPGFCISLAQVSPFTNAVWAPPGS